MSVARHEANDDTNGRKDDSDSKNKKNSGHDVTDRSDTGPPPLKGYLYIGIGIMFILSPIVSSVSFFLPPSQDYENRRGDGAVDRLLHRYWDEVHPFLRVLTILPPTIVICICHWVSLRIYLRR
mmetsp:Transcript_5561/g.13937  ORF Transcript_5561/g.13937 Transcript_5561/m.13937 type:complete len:124 (-) Transcript_5561:263-634(-)